MLLFKKKSVCGASVTRLVLNMIYVRKWFFFKKKKIKLEIYPCTMLL